MMFLKIMTLFTLIVAGTFSSTPVKNTVQNAIENEGAKEILEAADYNYTRTTMMFLNADAFAEVSEFNYFEFTQSRITLWTENALYMHNASASEGVNSGYLNENGRMKHYHLSNGHESIGGTKDDVIIDRDDGAYNIHDFDGFGTLHKIKKLSLNESLSSRFTLVDGIENRYQMVFDNTRKDEDKLIELFMYFIAPVYTNPTINDDEYLHFDRVEISFSSSKDEVNYYLYVEDADCSKLDSTNQSTGLFASAVVNNIETTTIVSVSDYLNL